MAMFHSLPSIHVKHQKNTAELESVIMPVPAEVTISMSQHIGAPCKPVVKVGDTVKVGQLIGDSEAAVSAPIHSSVSGKVKAIEQIFNARGAKSEAIVITTDGEQTIDETLTPPAIGAELEDVLVAARACGLMGLGGAGFPTSVKLVGLKSAAIDTLVINGAECEPYLTCDDRLMCERATGILRGAELLMRAVGVSRCLVGIEHNKPEAIKAMTRAAESFTGIEIVPLRTKYPQGGEKQLIEALTGRQVPSGKLPAAVGCIVDNVASAYAVYEAVWLRKPLIERVVTVTGRGLELPGNYLVPLGTNLAHLLEGCVWDDSTSAEVIAGGPMMGRSVSCLDAPVQKATSGLLTMDATMNKRRPEQPCIRCGRCMHGCPMGLEPFLLLAMSRKRMWQEMKDNFALDCIECGSCSWSCPAYKPLLDFIKIGKMEIRKRKL